MILLGWFAEMIEMEMCLLALRQALLLMEGLG
jgi:hypothetical protein